MYTLLIADDESLEREALNLFVRESNLEIDRIIECRNGTETVKTALLEKPDIIILDINMPGLNGLEALEKIQISHKKCKVIFSTAFDYFEYAIKALQLGAMDFLVKPVKSDVLVRVLNKAVDQLDSEQEQEEQAARMGEAMDLMGYRIAEELLDGSLSEEVLHYLSLAGLEASAPCQLVRLHLDSLCNQEKGQDLLRYIREMEQLLDVRTLGFWQEDSMNLILFFQRESYREELRDRALEVLANCLKNRSLKYTWDVGDTVNDISQLESVYCAMGGKSCRSDDEAEPGESDIPMMIQRALSYMEQNYSRQIGLDDIADTAGLSRYYLCRLFKQNMGKTVLDYLVQYRIERACELLGNGIYSIKQISAMVGYTDPNYFSLSFRKTMGVAPVKYRYSGHDAGDTRKILP